MQKYIFFLREWNISQKKKEIHTTFRAIALFLQKVKEQIEFRIDTYHVLFGQDLKFELSGHTFSEK